jgi:hypothetical protein
MQGKGNFKNLFKSVRTKKPIEKQNMNALLFKRKNYAV